MKKKKKKRAYYKNGRGKHMKEKRRVKTRDSSRVIRHSVTRFFFPNKTFVFFLLFTFSESLFLSGKNSAFQINPQIYLYSYLNTTTNFIFFGTSFSIAMIFWMTDFAVCLQIEKKIYITYSICNILWSIWFLLVKRKQ